MINLVTNKQLNIIVPNTNKALAEVLKGATPKQLESLSQGKDLNSLLNTMLKQSAQEPSQDKTLLTLLKNNPTLKELGNVTSTIKDLHTILKQDKEPLPLEKVLKNFMSDLKDMSEKELKTKLQNSGVFLESKIKNATDPKLELKSLMQEFSKTMEGTKLQNVQQLNSQLKDLLSSNIFSKEADIKALVDLSKKVQVLLDKFSERLASPLDKSMSKNDVLFSKESTNLLEKITNLNTPDKLQAQTQLKDMFSNDLKAVLLKSKEELNASQHPNKQELLKHMDKLALQIDYYQLSSHLSNSSSLYLPYSWEDLEDGNITLKSTQDDKFFCDIELQLKEHGELKLRLGMFEKNQLNINITAQSKKLKNLIQENMPELKKQLFSVGIRPREIRFLETTNTTSPYGESRENFAMGFEVKA